jgi:hypothetical protein
MEVAHWRLPYGRRVRAQQSEPRVVVVPTSC